MTDEEVVECLRSLPSAKMTQASFMREMRKRPCFCSITLLVER